MLKIDSLLLEAFYDENKEFLEDAKVQKIQQPTRRELILHLRKNEAGKGGESRKLYININPQFHHLAFMDKETEARRDLSIPKQPPMFCMLLRKHMEGAKILKVEKPEFERIIEIYFENYNEIGDRIENCLSIEMMGKHSNIVLYNTDNNIILGCAHNIGEEKSKERELAGGLPFIYPPKQDKKNLLTTRFDWFTSALSKSEEPIKKTLSSKYFSTSQALAEELCTLQNINPETPAEKLKTEEIQKLFVSLHEFLASTKIFTVSADYKKYSCLQTLDRKYDSVNALIDDYFSYHMEQNLISNMKTNLKTKLNKDLKKLYNTLSGQNKVLEKREKAEIYMVKGNLLTANAHAIKHGESSVRLTDWTQDKEIEIELDETLTPIENAQRYFNLYNKAKRAAKVAEEMSEETKNEIANIEEVLYSVEAAETLAELKETRDEPDAPKKNKEPKEIKIEKREIDGFTVFIGKNAKQNDYLYSKISSPDDLWFHALNTPGAHIIAKAPHNRTEIKDQTILKIAEIAKEFSNAKNSTKAAITYTLRKYVKRPNNTKKGFVVYKNETEIVVN